MFSDIADDVMLRFYISIQGKSVFIHADGAMQRQPCLQRVYTKASTQKALRVTLNRLFIAIPVGYSAGL
ncbi:MAG TPA: hypothetical protein DD979_12145 [Gammaproteobacteria bacterium]|jgi:hypothetical protein|nr:hypothetical protein [Gammaproteobacteria bacterium]